MNRVDRYTEKQLEQAGADSGGQIMAGDLAREQQAVLYGEKHPSLGTVTDVKRRLQGALD